jgi:hypothetical protein
MDRGVLRSFINEVDLGFGAARLQHCLARAEINGVCYKPGRSASGAPSGVATRWVELHELIPETPSSNRDRPGAPRWRRDTTKQRRPNSGDPGDEPIACSDVAKWVMWRAKAVRILHEKRNNTAAASKWKTPQWMRCGVILEKKFSTALSQEVEVGVKWEDQRA